MVQSLEVMSPVVYPYKLNFKQFFFFICFLFFFLFLEEGGGGSIVLDHLNFFKYITSSMFKGLLDNGCLPFVYL